MTIERTDMAVDQTTIKKDLREFIVDNFMVGSEDETLNDSDSFMEKGIVDSTGVLELTSFVEEKYDFTIEDDEMLPENLDSIDNLVKFISRKKG
jgi:acyl carrier protein